MLRALWSGGVALLALAGLGALLYAYPLYQGALVAALAAYAVLLCWRPQAWLAVLPALLPVFDLAPRTGWFFLEELDLVVLATLGVGYLRTLGAAPAARWPGFFRFLVGLFGACFALAAIVGLLPIPALDDNALTNYTSHFNALREFKGFLWALLLFPLFARTAGPDLVNVRRWFVPGMLAGLALACGAVLVERALFPGLFNFSSDYRPTGSFSAMHTGGAALDAYLAICFPLVTLWLTDAAARLRQVLALLLLLAGCYAGFTTFSRDVFLAYGAAVLIIGGLSVAYQLRRGMVRPAAVLVALPLLGSAGAALALLFQGGGYRGLLAGLLLLATALVAGGARARLRQPGLTAAGALAGAAAAGALHLAVDKGAYVAVALAALAGAAGALAYWRDARASALALWSGALGALAIGTPAVARHWGGPDALPLALPAVLLALALFALNRVPRTPLWPLGRATFTGVFLAAIVFGTVIPVGGSYYFGSRLATVGNDLGDRVRHWEEAVDMMRPELTTTLFGMGLGRYPLTYAWNNTHGEMPGNYSFEQEGVTNQFLRLDIPQYAIGYGEMLRFVQHVGAPAGRVYAFALDVKRSSDNAHLHAALCERWLIYPQACREMHIKLAPPDGKWHHYEVTLGGGAAPRGPAWWQPPVQLEISGDGSGAALDVDNVSLRAGAAGAELVRNGGFSNGMDEWFFSSDHNHLPWHVKNFAVNALFETGWVGLCAAALLLLYAAGSLLARGLHGELEASVYLAGVTGMMIVGMFDSLVDVPRLTLLLFLVLMVALAQARPPARSRARPRPMARARPQDVPD